MKCLKGQDIQSHHLHKGLPCHPSLSPVTAHPDPSVSFSDSVISRQLSPDGPAESSVGVTFTSLSKLEWGFSDSESDHSDGTRYEATIDGRVLCDLRSVVFFNLPSTSLLEANLRFVPRYLALCPEFIYLSQVIA